MADRNRAALDGRHLNRTAVDAALTWLVRRRCIELRRAVGRRCRSRSHYLLRRCRLLRSGLGGLCLLLNDLNRRQLVCGGRRRRCRLLCWLSVGLRRRGLRLLLNDVDWWQLIAGRRCRCAAALPRSGRWCWAPRCSAPAYLESSWCRGSSSRPEWWSCWVSCFGVVAFGAVVLGAGAAAPPAGGGEGCVCWAVTGGDREQRHHSGRSYQP